MLLLALLKLNDLKKISHTAAGADERRRTGNMADVTFTVFAGLPEEVLVAMDQGALAESLLILLNDDGVDKKLRNIRLGQDCSGLYRPWIGDVFVSRKGADACVRDVKQVLQARDLYDERQHQLLRIVQYDDLPQLKERVQHEMTLSLRNAGGQPAASATQASMDLYLFGDDAPPSVERQPSQSPGTP